MENNKSPLPLSPLTVGNMTVSEQPEKELTANLIQTNTTESC